MELKRFLWEEGVKGPDEKTTSLRVYPARAFVDMVIALYTVLTSR